MGRPFPLEEADEHFSRLRAWGLTLVRLLVPWESLEHSGPGIYDEEYIEYLRKLIDLMPKYGLKCVIDPHQDTVSIEFKRNFNFINTFLIVVKIFWWFRCPWMDI